MLPRLNRTTGEMEELDRTEWVAGISFRAYGLRLGLRANQVEVLERLMECFPRGWKLARSPVVDYLYSVVIPAAAGHSDGFHLLYANERSVTRTQTVEEMVLEFYIDLHSYVAATAQRRLFLHAGVVGWRGQAILIPGKNFSGKTSLVHALLRAGASYYSDEFAVLDTRGRVHPYPTPMYIRMKGMRQPTACPVELIGGKVGKTPLPIGLVVFSTFRQGAKWRPRPLSAGQAILALLVNVMSKHHPPEVLMPILRQAVAGARILKGVRGEADGVVNFMLGKRFVPEFVRT